MKNLKQGQEGGRWHLGESVTELWPHCPGWRSLHSQHWGLQNGTTTPPLPSPFQPLRREQRRGSVCPQQPELARLKGCLVSSSRVRSHRKKATKPAVGTGNTGMESANAVTRSGSQVSDLSISPLSILAGYLSQDGLQDCST